MLRAGGFRAASRRLGVSPAHVSETVARLETRLGLPLLTRTTRSVAPTEAGRLLAERAAPLLEDTRAALLDAANAHAELRGRLRLSVPGAVAVDILPPLLDRYLRVHPQVAVELVVDDRLIDLAEAGCDAGIRYSEHLAQDMIAVPIGPPMQNVALAASPAYLAARGIPAHPRELMLHDCIRLRFTSGALVPWELGRGTETLTLDPPSRLIVGTNGYQVAIALACAGHGIVGTFGNWLDPHLADGSLLPVLPGWWQEFEGPRLYFTRRSISAPLRAFVDLVARERHGPQRSAVPIAAPHP